MTTFALVHGAWHDGWCWERLTPELEAAGHRTIAVDLPCEDPAATFETYAGVVVDALDGAGDDVVVVAHSLGGHTAPLVAARRAVRAVVYVCALVPLPGVSLREQMLSDAEMLVPGYADGLGEPDEQGRRRWVDVEAARATFYADCEPRLAREAVRRLRPQALAPYAEPFPLDSLGVAPATYVVCAEDRIVNPAWGRRVARERLDAEVVELPGSHSPFLSRPAELASAVLGALSAPPS